MGPNTRQTRTFKNTVIIIDKNLLSKDREDIQRWLRYRGAKFSTDVSDDVTHFIVAKETWLENSRLKEMEEMVTVARRKRTIFLMCRKWVKESLSLNNGKPKNEVDSDYTWDVRHAKQVWDSRKRKHTKARREMDRHKRAQLAAELATRKKAKGDSTHGSCSKMENMDVNEDAANNAKQQKAARKPQDVTECGLAYDRRLMQFERDQALRGFRPYIDENGVLYMITLVRQDVVISIKERYEIKLANESAWEEAESSMMSHDSTNLDVNSVSDDLARFVISDDTEAHYLDDDLCCPPRKPMGGSGRSSNTGILTPSSSTADIAPENFASSTVLEKKLYLAARVEYWAPHIPFSAYPIVPYRTGPGPQRMATPEARPPARVSLSEHVAYSLQLYESYDRPERIPEPAVPVPQRDYSSYTSFTSLLPEEFQPEQKRSSTLDSSISPPATVPYADEDAPERRQYHLVVHYTRRPARNSTKDTEFVPYPGGKHQGRNDLDYALHIWKWFFHEKTKMKWEDVVGGKHSMPSRRDSGTGLPEDMDDMYSNCTNFDARPPTVAPAKVDPAYPAVWEVNDTPLALQDISQQCVKKPFRYVPNQRKHIGRIAKHYDEYYEEDWLPVDLAKLKFDAIEHHVEVDAQSKPVFQVCEDNQDGACECDKMEDGNRQIQQKS